MMKQTSESRASTFMDIRRGVSTAVLGAALSIGVVGVSSQVVQTPSASALQIPKTGSAIQTFNYAQAQANAELANMKRELSGIDRVVGKKYVIEEPNTTLQILLRNAFFWLLGFSVGFSVSFTHNSSKIK